MDVSFPNLSLFAKLQEQYERAPESLEPKWQSFLEGLILGESIAPKGVKEESVKNAFRTYGHLWADFNPLVEKRPEQPKELQFDIDVTFEEMRRTYCGKIGVEYMGFCSAEVEKWIQDQIEPDFGIDLSREEKLQIMDALNRAEIFETFIHTKYVGQKRFSLEGAETLIPMLELLKSKDVVIGMAHRGRLNVLANLFGKSYTSIFHEFEDHYTPDLIGGTGDVKYHKGFFNDLMTLVANPSHLESVDPVVEGSVRALQDQGRESLAVLIHGDAAVAGQGVVYETMQLAHLEGYGTKGTLHIVINNQIGFTALPEESRSTRYCTDIAKAFGAPVFHVNAEDPEGCVHAMKLALEIRNRFGCDVFIDLNGYRKYGHNESDEPFFTQPLEYTRIREKQSIREIYKMQLLKEGIFSSQAADAMESEFRESLHHALSEIPTSTRAAPPSPIQHNDLHKIVKTAVDLEKLESLTEAFTAIPEGFNINPKIKRLQEERLKKFENDQIDWGLGEHLAFATLLDEGTPVRLSGQDSERGTFSHRHAVWTDQKEEKMFCPLEQIGPFNVYNSPLSEFAVLGFEFGYSQSRANSLVLWEAQFGDFSNGAQIIIDQYLTTSEQKWGQTSSLTVLLPHGHEGQGPEHSSARIERFLQLCGEDNIQVVNPSTPAQLFHVLRRQVLSDRKKPLVIFTPKALLRHAECVSPKSAFTSGSFEEIIDDPLENAKRLIFCTGKIYYELLSHRDDKTAIVRLEQLYPLNENKLASIFKRHKGVEKCLWVQEEHQNMGAYEYIRPFLERFSKIEYAGRGRSASPAAGSYALHKMQLDELLKRAFS